LANASKLSALAGGGVRAGALVGLARRARENDPVAREELARRLIPIVAFSVRLELGAALRRLHTVEDVCQAAFVRICASLADLELSSDGRLRAWIRTVVRHTVCDLHGVTLAVKRRPRSEVVSLDGVDDEEVLSSLFGTARADGVPESADLHERFELVLSCMGALDPEEARLVQLVDVEGWTLHDAARALEVPGASTRTRRLQALVKLAIAVARRRARSAAQREG
jgi:RNA polymerase sigma factor (sigma-70 family)